MGLQALTAPALCLPPSFWERLVVNDATGCWEWIGGQNGKGYGMFSKGYGSRLIHRLTYEELVGPIPDGFVIDHLCKVRHCGNPSHLEPVTPAENARRGEHPSAARSARQTHCMRGHPLAGWNLIVDSAGRHCRECKRYVKALKI